MARIEKSICREPVICRSGADIVAPDFRWPKAARDGKIDDEARPVRALIDLDMPVETVRVKNRESV